MASTKTHTAAAITAVGKVEEIQLPTIAPGQGEVLVKVAYGAMIPFDTYQSDTGYAVVGYPTVLGFSVGGTVVEVGPGTRDLKAGDRIIAFSYIPPLAKATQEYATLPHTVVGKIPNDLPFDQAAAFPDNFVCAFYTLFNQLKLPIPSSFPSTTPPPNPHVPILIYGAGSTAGQYAIQLLKLAGYTNIVATASPSHHDYITSLGAHAVIDYRSPSLEQEVTKAFGGKKAKIVLDAISSRATLKIISKLVDENEATMAILLPVKKGEGLIEQSAEDYVLAVPEGDANPLPKGVTVVGVRTFLYQQDEYLKENLMPKILPKLLADGLIAPNKVRLMEQGSLKDRVLAGLELLRTNQVRGEKLIVKVIP